MENNINTIGQLIEFAYQRPGLNFADYGDVKIYRLEAAEITRDLNDFKEMLYLAQRLLGEELNDKLTNLLSNSSGRLTLNNGKIHYCTGQYFPTEYRAAATAALKSLIWDYFRSQVNEDNTPVYQTGNQIRAKIRKYFGRRINKLYFN